MFLGIAEDYFSHVGAVALKLKAPLTVGERIRVKGHTTDLTQEVSSLQIDRLPVERAKKGDSVGILVSARARRGDAVYKV
ncbi:MAG: translation elongation factor-like protein [Elusimicrobia bacterium]|nr:translation elongation factor-like protein [Elusimicrobiota bacterium]